MFNNRFKKKKKKNNLQASQTFFINNFKMLKKLYKLFYKKSMMGLRMYNINNFIFLNLKIEEYIFFFYLNFVHINTNLKKKKKYSIFSKNKPFKFKINYVSLLENKKFNFLFYNKFFFIKQNKTFFYKTNLTRPRQDYKVGVIWSLIANFFFIFICYFYFYKIFVILNFYFWFLFIFCFFLAI